MTNQQKAGRKHYLANAEKLKAASRARGARLRKEKRDAIEAERTRLITKGTLIREGDKRVIEDLNMSGIGVALNKFFEQPVFDYVLRNDRDPYPNMHQGSEQ